MSILASAAIFGPPTKPPTKEYLDLTLAYARQHPQLKALVNEISNLQDVWRILATESNPVAALSQGPRLLQALTNGIETGNTEPLSQATSGIINLPVLILLHTVQYFQYLQLQEINHEEFLAQVRAAGGIQGNCGGLFAAAAIACAKDEEEVIQNAMAAVRFALAVGAYGEVGDDSTVPGTSSIVVRLRRESQVNDVLSRFPDVYVSNVAAPRLINFAGRPDIISEFIAWAKREHLTVQEIHIRGRLHHPGNGDLAVELHDICHRNKILWLPDASKLQVTFRSNDTGASILQGSLTDDFVHETLTGRCEWYKLLTNVANDLTSSARPNHTLLNFGVGDCVSKAAFNERHLQVKVIDVQSLTSDVQIHEPTSDTNEYTFPDDAIAIIGASCRLPGANNLDELGELLYQGKDCHSKLPEDRFDLPGSFRASLASNFVESRRFFGNFLEKPGRFDHAFFNMSSKDAVYVDPQQRILLELAYEALESSGYFPHRCHTIRDVGCFIGSVLSDYAENTNAHQPNARVPTGTFRAFLCGKLCHHFGWTSPSEVIDTACSSSLVAVYRACRSIRAGECSMAVAGGMNVISSSNNFLDLARAGFISPTGQCKPFDNAADGYCRGEGGGLVVLKSLNAARRDDDQILGVIAGIATNQGGQSESLVRPHKPAQVDLFRDVLRRAGMSPEQVTYLEAHGTGTQAGDPIELQSVREVFGSQGRKHLNIGSVKGNVGHSEAAAGITGLLKVLVMARLAFVPALVNHKSLNVKIPPLEPDGINIARHSEQWNVSQRVACVNSYAASGSNAAALFCEAPSRTNKMGHTEDFSPAQNIEHPVIISAHSTESLSASVQAIVSYLTRTAPQPRLEDIAFTLNTRRKRYKNSCVVSAPTTKILVDRLRGMPTSFDCYDRPAKKVAMVCAGQSKRCVGLKRAFYDAHTAFRNQINVCDAILQSLGYDSLFPSIFESRPSQSVVLLQVGTFAVQYACARSWIDAGLHVSAIIGHSLGELSGLAISGILSLQDCIKLIARRAWLMQERWGPEPGVMLLVYASRALTQQIVKEFNESARSDYSTSNLEIACFNGPGTQIVVGTSQEVEDFERNISAIPQYQSLNLQRLNTSHGFHSKLTEPILEELDMVAKSLTWCKPRIPIETCTSEGQESWSFARIIPHTRQPVHFEDAVRRVESRHGPCTWLEAGIDKGAVHMVKNALLNPEQHSYHCLVSDVAIEAVVSDTTLALWKQGVICSTWSARKPDPIWLPPYQFRGPDLWLPNIDRAAEALKRGAHPSPNEVVKSIPEPPRLVKAKPSTTDEGHSWHYSINTSCGRFQKAVLGHRVGGQPVCPAGMYMECVIMALHLTNKDLAIDHISFENIEIQAPLALAPSQDVILTLSRPTQTPWWDFKFVSTCGSSSNSTSHASGRVSFPSSLDLGMLQRLLSSQMGDLSKRNDTECLQSGRAYQLFSRVIDYADYFQGIAKIILDTRQSIAEVTIPAQRPHSDESTSIHHCDAMIIDVLVHSVGLAINSSDLVAPGDVIFGTGFGKIAWMANVQMESGTRWKVYTKFEATTNASYDSPAVADIFISTMDDLLVMTINGCRFKRLPLKILTKLLASANLDKQSSQTSEKISTRTQAIPSIDSSPATSPRGTPDSLDSAPASSQTSVTTPNSESDRTKPVDAILRNMIHEYAGVPEESVEKRSIIGDLGIDSLTAIEMTDEIASRFGKAIAAEELATMTFDSLKKTIATGMPTNTSTASTSESLGAHTIEARHISGGPSDLSSGQELAHFQTLHEIVAECCGVTQDALKSSVSLSDLGIDSLSIVEMKDQVEEAFNVRIKDDDLTLDSTISDLATYLSIDCQDAEKGSKISPETEVEAKPVPLSAVFHDPRQALAQAESHFQSTASRHGFVDYWSKAAVLQDELSVAFVLEAYRNLGIDLQKLAQDVEINAIPCLPKYERLAEMLLLMLEEQGFIVRKEKQSFRTNRKVYTETSDAICQKLITLHSSYEIDAKLMQLTGPKLADCLVGKANPMALLFGNGLASKIVDSWYSETPMLATMIDQLVEVIQKVLPDSASWAGKPLQVLEIGAGSGATTGPVVAALEALGMPVEYVFTDIAPRLVQKAKTKFAKYAFMSYSTFNLESEPPTNLRDRFDLIIGTNCVHATASKANSLRHIRGALNKHGLVILSEAMRRTPYCDITFGLLDGWWLAPEYPLQPAEVWMSEFQAANFAFCTYSRGDSPEANTQSLLMGMKSDQCLRSQEPTTSPDPPPVKRMHRMKTVAFKTVDGIDLLADLYLPKNPQNKRMPIALMIHGGGYVTLSRKVVRPAQTSFLLSQGILPVSIDYRLCPEINLLEGAMIDARDAMSWIRTSLPSVVRNEGLVVDSSKVVVIGWSTGGHLAMTTSWTTREAGIEPPNAILSFYGPTDFESGELDDVRPANLPNRTLSWKHVAEHLPSRPLTGYNVKSDFDQTRLGVGRPGDPRSELMLAMFTESEMVGLPLLLSGHPRERLADSLDCEGEVDMSKMFQRPSKERVAAISPMAQVRRGRYQTPTYLIHSTDDEVVKFSTAQRFVSELRRSGVIGELLALEGLSHIHDLELRPETTDWATQVEPGYRFLIEAIKDGRD